ncbi:MAG TPA: UvrD-helicase domain-containing protein [Candidatus Polarisedimenticolia bacterium]|nr:UvrD-helicase domain-containing protein [Candidatus Polarisedimenticolia bacterium]
MEELLSSLNPQQREAVQHVEGPLLIVAGAGSGKTRVIVHRLAWILAHRLAAPHEVVAVTFTNKAAGEMKERVDELVGADHGGALVSTFHSYCLRLLRRYGPRIGYGSDFLVYDEADQQSLMKDCLETLGIDEETFPPRQARSRISDAKNRGLDPEGLRAEALGMRDEQTAKLFALYQERLAAANAMDFDDLIGQVLRLFDEHPDVRQEVASRVRYLLVDEYQDTNPPQYRLIRHLASVHGNVCAVGDPDQSIYKFRFADIKNILSYEDDFPGTHLIKLEQNYRSTNNILSAATALVRHNRSRIDKELWSEAPAGEPIDLMIAADDRGEADRVVQEVRSLRRGGQNPESMAILYRTNAQSRLLEEALTRAGIPYVMIGGTRFYDRKEVRDLLAYLRLLLNPKDDASLRRILNVPARDIGKTTLEVVQDTTRRDRLPLLEAVEKLAAEGPRAAPSDSGRTLTTRAQKALQGFVDLLRDLREAARDLPPSRLVARIVSRVRFEEHLAATSPGDAQARIENLQELANAVAAYDGMEGGLTAFLDRTALLSETDNTQGSSGVRMMTLHSAKGLEFDTVFIVGVEEELCPHLRAAENEADLEEERRLLYVGMTRARKRLLLSRAETRFQFGQQRTTEPSRFLQEIPRTLLRVQTAEAVERWARSPRPVRRFERSPAPAVPRSGAFWTPDPGGGEAPTPPSAFSLGCKVHHAEYGVGTVIGIEGAGDQQKVTVSFSIVGSKKFLPRFARLERL